VVGVQLQYRQLTLNSVVFPYLLSMCHMPMYCTFYFLFVDGMIRCSTYIMYWSWPNITFQGTRVHITSTRTMSMRISIALIETCNGLN